jgi:hypothetical protein
MEKEEKAKMVTVPLRKGDLIHINGIPLRIIKEGEATTSETNFSLLQEKCRCKPSKDKPL